MWRAAIGCPNPGSGVGLGVRKEGAVLLALGKHLGLNFWCVGEQSILAKDTILSPSQPSLGP